MPGKKKEHKERIPEDILPVDATSHKVGYTAVVQAQGTKKKDLMNTAKKWVAGRNTAANPWSITESNDKEGSIGGTGRFLLASGSQTYSITTHYQVFVKDGRFMYDFTDFMLQHTGAEAGKRGKKEDKRNLEYGLETFYPSRINSDEPEIRGFEDVDADFFKALNREMQTIVGSLKKQLEPKNSNW
jgi:hypothetical protein